MMSPEWLRASARYNRWMNDKLYGLAASLGEEVRKRDVGAFFKSIHGTFNHLLLRELSRKVSTVFLWGQQSDSL